MSDVELTIKQQNDFCGITKWHDAGVDGKGVVVWNTEDIGSSHGEIVTRRIQDAAPKAFVIQAGLEMMTDGTGVKYAFVKHNGKQYEVEDFIKTFKVKVVTRSVGGGTATNTTASKFWNNLKAKYNLIFFNSAGNDGSKGCGGSFAPDVAIYVGACTLNAKGKPVKASYSSIGEELDFMGFVGVWSGTSFAAPYLAGMTALLCQKNPNITQDEVYEYYQKNALDMQTEGRDDYTGNGLARMGDVEEMRMEVRIPIGSRVMTVNGKTVELDQPAIIDKSTNRTLVPVRAISEAFGFNVEWDAKNRVVIITE